MVAPITIGSFGFVTLLLLLVLCAWLTPLRRYFLAAMVAANVAMLASWLRDAMDLFALLAFLLPPYLAAKAVWGRGKGVAKAAVFGTILMQLFMFLVFRHYPGFDLFTMLGHPVRVIGISYVMFRQIHLLVDAPYSTEPFSAARYFAYLTAVWTLLAGPIQRYPDFVEGLQSVGRPDEADLMAACHRITTGILKSFAFAPIFFETANIQGFGGPEEFNILRWLTAFYSYFIFLFLDFSGYTDIVIGAAALCRFKTIPENFDQPYLSTNVQEFWSRWHISLGTWFRDYFYIPVFRWLGEKTGWRGYTLLNIAALFLTFLTVGVWHGPGSNFLAFGILQAVGVGSAVAWRELRDGLLPAMPGGRGTWRLGSRLLCFHYICGSFLLLDNSIRDVVAYFQSLGAWIGVT